MSSLFLGLLNQAISAGWLILAVILVRLLFRSMPKNMRCLMWGLAGLRLVLPVRLKSVLSLIPSSRPVPAEITTAAVPAIDSGIPAVNRAVNPVLAENLAPAVGDSANPLQIAAEAAAWLWLAGLLILLSYALLSTLRLRRRVADSVPEGKNIRLSGRIGEPFVLGLLRPVIYLPWGLEGEQRDLILAHENAHIARHDHWWKPLGFLLLAVFWFQPLCWLAYALFCRDLELACDERVLSSLGPQVKKAYSHALLDCSAASRPFSACPLAFGETGVRQRIRNVLRYRRPARPLLIAAGLLCLTVAVCFLTDPVDANALSGKEGTFLESLEAGHVRTLGYEVLTRDEYIARYGDNLVRPASIPSNFTLLDRVYVWPEDHFPAVKQVWYDDRGEQAVFVLQQNQFQDDGLPFNLFNGYTSGRWTADLPWAAWYATDEAQFGDRWVSLQYYAADYEGYGTQELPMLREGNPLVPELYETGEDASGNRMQQFLASVWEYEQVGSLYTPMEYGEYFTHNDLPLAVLPDLPARFQSSGYVYVWQQQDAMNHKTLRVLQIWIDPEAQEAVSVSQAELPGRNSVRDASYTKLNRQPGAGSNFPWEHYPWLVWQYSCRLRLGENIDTRVFWYGPEDLGEENCRAMLDRTVLGEPQAAAFAPTEEESRDGFVYTLSIGEELPLDMAFGVPVSPENLTLAAEDEAFVSLRREGGQSLLAARKATEDSHVVPLTAEYEGRTLRVFIRILPAEPELQIMFYSVVLEQEFTIHLSDEPVLLYAVQDGRIVDAVWREAGGQSLILTQDADGCYVGPGDRTAPEGTALVVEYGGQEKQLTVYVLE